MDIILEAVKKSSEPLETDLNKKKNLTFSYKKPNLKTIASILKFPDNSSNNRCYNLSIYSRKSTFNKVFGF